MKEQAVQVYSEIGKLEAVILHRPGKELLNVVPGMMEELLFDEIPYLEVAQEEHDQFAQVLRETGTEVYYLEDLASEAVTSQEIKEEFVDSYLDEADIFVPWRREYLRSLLLDLDNKEMVFKMMEGTRKCELPSRPHSNLSDMISGDDFFVAKPMPNLYFTRDPFSFIGSGVSLNHMWSNIRRRETLFGKMIFQYHPMFKDSQMPFWFHRDLIPSLEGGDIIVLSDKVLAVGISQRSKPWAVEILTKNLLSAKTNFETVLVLTIPNTHAFMHLDTVFTSVDKDLFTLHPGVDDTLCIYSIKLKGEELFIQEESSNLEDVLKKYLELDEVHLIREGSGTLMDATREQWSDGYNTLAIAPREVIVYDRNTLTNEELDKYGAKLHILRSGELSRGRGGPRCMSMPIRRTLL